MTGESLYEPVGPSDLERGLEVYTVYGPGKVNLQIPLR